MKYILQKLLCPFVQSFFGETQKNEKFGLVEKFQTAWAA